MASISLSVWHKNRYGRASESDGHADSEISFKILASDGTESLGAKASMGEGLRFVAVASLALFVSSVALGLLSFGTCFVLASFWSSFLPFDEGDLEDVPGLTLESFSTEDLSDGFSDSFGLAGDSFAGVRDVAFATGISSSSSSMTRRFFRCNDSSVCGLSGDACFLPGDIPLFPVFSLAVALGGAAPPLGPKKDVKEA